MQDSAFANFSTAPNFIVIIARNLLTGETKEVCTEAPFVTGGLDRNQPTTIVKNNKVHQRYYYFNTKSALENIGFNGYSYTDLLLYGQKKEVRRIVNLILRSNAEQSYDFQGSIKEQSMFAHILFNNGIMATRGCIAGNLMELKKANWVR